MAFGILYPHIAERRTYQLSSEELVEIVQSALQDLGWSPQLLGINEFQARVPASGWASPHEFKVRLLPGGVLEAESKSTDHERLFDFGRNSDNVELFFAIVDGIRQGVHPRPLTAAPPGAPGQGHLTPPQNQLAVNFLGCCIVFAFISFFIYSLVQFICAIIGLLTGTLLLLGGRSGYSITLHGVWARIGSALILAFYAWLAVMIGKGSSKQRGERK